MISRCVRIDQRNSLVVVNCPAVQPVSPALACDGGRMTEPGPRFRVRPGMILFSILASIILTVVLNLLIR